MTEGPLHGIRVLEFSQIVAAPFCGCILSDQGADVVKIEGPSGDPHRNAGAVVPGLGKRFQSLNRGKRSLAVDLQVPEGRQLIYRLIPDFDVVLINFRVGVAARLCARRRGADIFTAADGATRRRAASAWARGEPSRIPESKRLS